MPRNQWHENGYINCMRQPDYRLTREEVCVIEEDFRSMTQKVANWLIVVKALAELANENNEIYEKLISKRLMQCPELVFQIQAFSDEMYKRMNPLIPNEIPCPEWMGNYSGKIVSGIPWTHKSYKERLQILKSHQNAMQKKPWPACPDEKESAEMRLQYDLLRATIERGIQDVF